jgi:hypothetical protein
MPNRNPTRVYYGLDFPVSKLSKAKKVSGTTSIFFVFQVPPMLFCHLKSKLNIVCNINQLEKNSPGKCAFLRNYIWRNTFNFVTD